MSEAQRLAARRAIEGLGVAARSGAARRQVGLRRAAASPSGSCKGDARCLSIAAASILAKVTRDRIMRAEAEHYPWWWFDQNKGYPCPRHKAVAAGRGPVRHPPPELGVHGLPAVGRRPPAGAPRPAGHAVRLTQSGRGCTRTSWPTHPTSPTTPTISSPSSAWRTTSPRSATSPTRCSERLDELGEGIDAARRQAEADDLLPEREGDPTDGPPIAHRGVPRGDERRETPVDDADVRVRRLTRPGGAPSDRPSDLERSRPVPSLGRCAAARPRSPWWPGRSSCGPPASATSGATPTSTPGEQGRPHRPGAQLHAAGRRPCGGAVAAAPAHPARGGGGAGGLVRSPCGSCVTSRILAGGPRGRVQGRAHRAGRGVDRAWRCSPGARPAAPAGA